MRNTKSNKICPICGLGSEDHYKIGEDVFCNKIEVTGLSSEKRKAYNKAYQKSYQKTDKNKAYKKAYQKTDKFKAYKKAYYLKKKAKERTSDKGTA